MTGSRPSPLPSLLLYVSLCCVARLWFLIDHLSFPPSSRRRPRACCRHWSWRRSWDPRRARPWGAGGGGCGTAGTGEGRIPACLAPTGPHSPEDKDRVRPAYWLKLHKCSAYCTCSIILPIEGLHSGVQPWPWREAAGAERTERWSGTACLSGCQTERTGTCTGQNQRVIW